MALVPLPGWILTSDSLGGGWGGAAVEDTAVAAVAAGEEECPSSFVIEAMGELDVLGTVTWRISLSGIQISESESCGKI